MGLTRPVQIGASTIPLYLECLDVVAFRTERVESGVDVGPIEYPFSAPRSDFLVKRLRSEPIAARILSPVFDRPRRRRWAGSHRNGRR